MNRCGAILLALGLAIALLGACQEHDAEDERADSGTLLRVPPLGPFDFELADDTPSSDGGSDAGGSEDAGEDAGPDTEPDCTAPSYQRTYPPLGSAGAFLGVFGSSATDVYVVGSQSPYGVSANLDDGLAFHYGGESWSPIALPKEQTYTWIRGCGKDDIYVHGEHYEDVGTWVQRVSCFHFDGVAWAAAELPFGPIGQVACLHSGEVVSYSAGKLAVRGAASWSALPVDAPAPIAELEGLALEDLVALDADGAVWRFDGTSWAAVSNDTGALIEHIVLAPDGALFATGSRDMVDSEPGSYLDTEAVLMRRGGAGWDEIHVERGAFFLDVAARSADEATAVGSGELVVHWNGAGVEQISRFGGLYQTPTRGDALHWEAVTALDDGSIFAAGQGRRLLARQQGEWSWPNGLAHGEVNDVARSPAGRLYWAMGDTVLKEADGTYAAQQLPRLKRQRIRAVLPLAEDDVYAAGTAVVDGAQRAVIHHFDGTAWQQMDVAERRALSKAWISEIGRIYALRGDTADATSIEIYDGSSWAPMADQPAGYSYDLVSGTSEDDVYVGAMVDPDNGALHTEAQALWRWDGAEWTGIWRIDDAKMSRLWGRGPDDLYALGDTGTCYVGQPHTEADCTVFASRFDGSAWSTLRDFTFTVSNTTEFVPQFVDIWGQWPKMAIITGNEDGVDVYDGAAWSRLETGFGSGVVWGSGTDDVFLAGRGGTESSVWRWDGTAWQTSTIDLPVPPRVIGGSGPDDVWVAGGGYVQLYDGKSWTAPVRISAAQVLDVRRVGDRIIAVDSVGDVWDSEDAVLWTKRISGVACTEIKDLWSTAPGEIHAACGAGYLRLDGGRWVQEDIVVTGDVSGGDVQAGWGDPGGRGVAWTEECVGTIPDVSCDQRALLGDGATWTVAWEGTSLNGRGRLWGSGPDDVYLAAGGLLRFDGAGLAEVIPMTAQAQYADVTGLGADDVLVLAADGLRPVIARKHGGGWQAFGALPEDQLPLGFPYLLGEVGPGDVRIGFSVMGIDLGQSDEIWSVRCAE